MKNLVLANRVKLLRERNNYTQTQLAKKVGVSQAYISLVEVRGLVPSYYILYTLASVLHTSIDYLLPEQSEDLKIQKITILKDKIEEKCKEITILKDKVEEKCKEIEKLEAQITAIKESK